MRGQVEPQDGLFSYFSLEKRIPADRPLRRVKAQADAVLDSMGAQFAATYAASGRFSITGTSDYSRSLMDRVVS